MGTTLKVALAADERADGIRAIEEVFTEVRRLETVLSTWRDDSEIARLNGAPAGREVALSAELAGLLREARDWSRATGGAFDPAIGALVEAWDLRGEGRLPSPAERAEALGRTGLDRFDWNGSTVARRDEGAWLDTGGFGKGAALRAAARVLRSRGVENALLNFGGQVLALGGDAAGEAWLVPVAHPARRAEPVVALRVRGVSVSTSAQSERSLRVGGRPVGHLLDPRTGEPVPPWGSVTAVAADPLTADILSTALFVLGPDEALRWAEAHPQVGILVLEDGPEGVRRRWSEGMTTYLHTEE